MATDLPPCKDERKQNGTTPRNSSRPFIQVNYHWPTICRCVYSVSMATHKGSRAHLSATETIKAHHTLINLFCPMNERTSVYEWFWHVWIAISAHTHAKKNVYLGLHHLCVLDELPTSPRLFLHSLVTQRHTSTDRMKPCFIKVTENHCVHGRSVCLPCTTLAQI